MEKKKLSLKLPKDDIAFLKQLTKEGGFETISAMFHDLIQDMRKEHDQMTSDLIKSLEQLKPYLGEPDAYQNGQPAWSGRTIKQAQINLMKHQGDEGYKELEALLAKESGEEP